ncbi:alpha/beta hydrolase [Skermania sp. ID1734]|uniref:alpha/beta fold hydrolase n=1 Tax=Skermania sp. ID1734 TaxID=2597516 RepID=UPI00117F34BE|nr:alpha/beta hydrolase [Skermania sp. ID1734]TSE00938.1 alpha/beta hydrolase [Skermania sp. ID1734]
MFADLSRATSFLRPVGPPDRTAGAPPLPPPRTLALESGETTVRFVPGKVPVLLLHGWALTADVNFCHVINEIAARHGVLAADVRGHGRGIALRNKRFALADCADDAAAILDSLGIDRVVVCGYSLGGPIGLEFARRYPSRVAGLVFEATALAFDSPTDKIARPIYRLLRPLAKRHRRVGRTLPLRYFNHARRKNPNTAALWPWLRGELVQCDPVTILDVILAEYDFDFRPHVEEINSIPAAVVITARDRAVPSPDQRELATRLNAKAIEIDRDHDVFLTDPAVFRAATLTAIDHVLSVSTR